MENNSGLNKSSIFLSSDQIKFNTHIHIISRHLRKDILLAFKKFPLIIHLVTNSRADLIQIKINVFLCQLTTFLMKAASSLFHCQIPKAVHLNFLYN